MGRKKDEATPTQHAIVFLGIALLLFLWGAVVWSEAAGAKVVDGTVVDLRCGMQKDRSVRCIPTVQYEVDGAPRRLTSRLQFPDGELKHGQMVPVNLAADPVELVSASHFSGHLLVAFGGGIVMVLLGIAQIRRRNKIARGARG